MLEALQKLLRMYYVKDGGTQRKLRIRQPVTGYKIYISNG